MEMTVTSTQLVGYGSRYAEDVARRYTNTAAPQRWLWMLTRVIVYISSANGGRNLGTN